MTIEPVEKYIGYVHKLEALKDKTFNDIIFRDVTKFPEYNQKIMSLEEKIQYLVDKYPEVAEYKRKKDEEEEAEFDEEKKEFVRKHHMEGMPMEKAFDMVESLRYTNEDEYMTGACAFTQMFDKDFFDIEKEREEKEAGGNGGRGFSDELLDLLDNKTVMFLFIFICALLYTIVKLTLNY